MTDGACVIVKRFPYEEPHLTQLEIAASNGLFSGTLDLYCGVDDLQKIGAALVAFPSRVPDEYRFEYGSEDPARRSYRHFILRAYTIGLRGQCALQFAMNLNREAPDEGSCRFSLQAEPAQLARLGGLFLRLEAHPHGMFRWTPTDDDFTAETRGAP
jgi:hypothetical protein